MTTIRVPIAACYVDNVRFSGVGYGGYGSPYGGIPDPILLYNMIPNEGESDVPLARPIQLQIASVIGIYGAPVTLDPSVKVWVTSSHDSIKNLAYDQSGGGFQPGFSGSNSIAVYKQSPGSAVFDELWLTIDHEVVFQSAAVIIVDIEAQAGIVTLQDAYSFTVLNVSPPGISDILWLTPRRCLVSFSAAMTRSAIDGSTVGAVEFLQLFDSCFEIIGPATIQLRSGTPSSSWIGTYCALAGSADPRNNKVRLISAVNVAGKALTLDTTSAAGILYNDDGVDRDDRNRQVLRRRLRASVSHYKLSDRLAVDVALQEATEAASVLCTYLSIPIAANDVPAAAVPVGGSTDSMVELRWHDDVSYDRLYTLEARGVKDEHGNQAGGPGAPVPNSEAEINFKTPAFLNRRRQRLWQSLPWSDIAEDLDNSRELLQTLAAVDDLLDILEFRTQQMAHFDEPAFIPEQLISYLLYDLGNPFTFEATEDQKRRLAASLPEMYQKLGLVEGIEFILMFFFGYHFEVVPYWTSLDIWKLGYSTMGYLGPSGATGECLLGPSTAYARNCYEIISPVVLTAAQLAMVIEIAKWADPANMHLVRVVQPGGSGFAPTTYWVLNTHLLGISTVLGGV